MTAGRSPGSAFFWRRSRLLVFGQTLRHEFVNYDDDLYVYENPVVQKGLTWEGFRWALTYGNIGHWHPLTWLSHMLDCQFTGCMPAAIISPISCSTRQRRSCSSSCCGG